MRGEKNKFVFEKKSISFALLFVFYSGQSRDQTVSIRVVGKIRVTCQAMGT